MSTKVNPAADKNQQNFKQKGIKPMNSERINRTPSSRQRLHDQPNLKPNGHIATADKRLEPNPDHKYSPQQVVFGSCLNQSKQYSRASKPRESEQSYLNEITMQLQERIKNIHYYYNIRIEEEKAKTAERSSVIVELIEELQAGHAEKLQSMRGLIRQAEEEKRDVGMVDEKMTEIKSSIDELIEQSAHLKPKNGELDRRINKKLCQNQQKEGELSKLSEDLLESRNTLQAFEIGNLKHKKLSKQLLHMMEAPI